MNIFAIGALVVGMLLAPGAQVAPPYEPLIVVENFLTARDARDPVGAAGWCAMLFELQDEEDYWFIDGAALVTWLRLLTHTYTIERLTPLVAEGDHVTWTERLTRRGGGPEAQPTSRTVQVHAYVRDGKIAHLSGPYPIVPFTQATGSTIESTSRGAPSSPALSPLPLFLVSAAAVVVAGQILGRVGSLLSAAAYGARRRQP
jgi:hypothetical protein